MEFLFLHVINYVKRSLNASVVKPRKKSFTSL